MSWVPQTDFEEEIVNLQPDHDFIYGTLSEPQYTYPRPQAHIEYAESRNKEKKKEQGNNATNKINAKLKAITQVQRMANTKPLGEQPTIEDWDDNGKIVQEIVGMLRHNGLPQSVEQPLNENATISTFPIKDGIKVVKNRHKKVAYFFDENVFQLKQKASDSSGFESCCANDSLVSDFDEKEADTSCNSSSSLSSHLHATCDSSDLTNSFSSTLAGNKTFIDQHSSDLNAQRLLQYEKLLEDTASLSLSTDSATTISSTDSFKSADESHNSWQPLPDDYDIENLFHNCKDWPDLVKNKSVHCNLSACSDSSHSKAVNNSSEIVTADVNTTTIGNNKEKTEFLKRFMNPEHLENSTETTKSSSTASIKKAPCKPKSYASIAKEIKTKTSSPKPPEEKNPFEFIPFYTPRKMYALKRRGK